jgi:predicted nicotinamide N-methyase
MPLPLHLQSLSLRQLNIEFFVPDPVAVKAAYERGHLPFPYWSKVWPAALALSEFIVCHSHYVQGKTVLELGAGLGLPSLIAARYAKHVSCTDRSAEAVAVVAQSAAHLRFNNFNATVLNWEDLPQTAAADVLLLSDVNYKPENFDALIKIIFASVHKSTTVLLSTPQRLMAKTFVEPLLNLCAQKEEYNVEQSEGNAVVAVTVMALQKKNE